MGWKAIMCDTGCKQNGNVESYGLKTLHSPFEKDLMVAAVEDIKFRNARSDFQTTRHENRLIHS